MKKYFKILIASLAIVMFTGCGDFLDINDDPNNPLEAQMYTLLPAIQVRLADATGHSGLGGTAAFIMQHNVVRGDLNDYIVTPGTGTGDWNTLYFDCLTDIREMIKTGTEGEYFNYVGVAKIMKAYISTVLVDVWGDVPYTQSNMGSLEPTPSFDNGEAIYDAAFALIDEGLADLDKPSLITLEGDLIYGGNLNNWRKFANTLKLKMYNQLRLVRDVTAPVNALLANPDGLINSIDEDFELPYGSSAAPDDRNPSYPSQYAPGSKTSPNPYLYELMHGIDTYGHGGNFFPVPAGGDPRVPYYWHRQLVPNAQAQNPIAYPIGSVNRVTTTGFVSILPFSFNIDPNEGFDQSESATVQGLYPIGGKYDDGSGAKANNNGYGQTPQRILTYYARLFIEAELVSEADATPSPDFASAEEVTEAAIAAAFAKVNEVASAAGAPLMSASDINGYITSVMGVYAGNPLRTIMTQKWLASYGAALDTYTDYRRTGYPALHDGNSDLLPITVRTRDFVVSFPYPTNEIVLNPDSPDQRNPYLSKVFWDN